MTTVSVKLPERVAALFVDMLEADRTLEPPAWPPAVLDAFRAALAPKVPKVAAPGKPKKSRAGLLRCIVCKAKMGHHEDCVAAAATRVVLLDTQREWRALRALGVDIMRWDSPDTLAAAVKARKLPESAAEAARDGELDRARSIVASWRAAAWDAMLADDTPPETRASAPTAGALDETPRETMPETTGSVRTRYASDRARFKGRRRHDGRLRRRVAS